MDWWVGNIAGAEHRRKSMWFLLATLPAADCPHGIFRLPQNTLQGRRLGLSAFSQAALFPASQPHPQACSGKPSCEEGARRGNHQQELHCILGCWRLLSAKLEL